MPFAPPGSFIVRLADGQETLVESLSLLDEMARGGGVGPATMVHRGGSDGWIPARSVPEIASCFSLDPWSAWEDMDDQQAANLVQGFRQSDPEDEAGDEVTDPGAPLPLDANDLQPLDAHPLAGSQTRRTPLDRLPELPLAAVQPLDAPASKSTGRGAGPPAFIPDTLPVGPAPRQPTPARSRRWTGLIVFTAVMLGALGLVMWAVRTQATQVLPSPAVPSSSDPRPPSQPVAPLADGAIYKQLEQDVRSRMDPNLQDVRAPGDLKDALLIELNRVRLDVARVDASVVTWRGSHKDVPEYVEIRVHLRAHPEELDRQLAAVGLVVGKYIQHYDLEVPRLELVLTDDAGDARRLSIDPELARRLYARRMPLVDFLRQAPAVE